MAFDACFLSFVVRECDEALRGGKVEKIYQPARDEVILCFRAAGGSRRLLINAGSQNPRLHLTGEKAENPAVPPQFCMLLRKHLSGARFSRAVQLGFERAARLTFDAYDDLGFPTEKHLVCEVMGKYSNLMLTDADDKILAVLRPVDFTTSQKRQVLPGMRYELPPPQDKADPLTADTASFKALAAAGELSRSAEKFLTASYLGVASLTAREVVCRTTGQITSTLGEAGSPLADSFLAMMEEVRSGAGTPCLAVDEAGHAREYCFMELRHLAPPWQLVTFPTYGELLDRYFADRGREERVRQHGDDIFRLLKNAEARLEKKIALQSDELAACDEGETFRLYGDLLTANIYRLKRGMTEVTLENYMDDMKPVAVPLDARLTPAANAQRYYKKYNKTKSARTHLEEQLSIARGELDYVGSVLDALSRAEGDSELAEIREELREAGYAKQLSGKKPQKKKPATSILRFRTTDGRAVLCGKNNLANDYLTFRASEKTDWWFHAKSQHGSHVVMSGAGDEPTDRDFTEAAMIAATYSGYEGGQNVPVDYARVREIKKPPNAKPGFVIYHTNWTAYITPDRDAADALREK
ncbi:MAG: NFACT family protein [Clostridia bacterium]|nr:NFACT family protein [Clostridia bacterium]